MKEKKREKERRKERMESDTTDRYGEDIFRSWDYEEGKVGG